MSSQAHLQPFHLEARRASVLAWPGSWRPGARWHRSALAGMASLEPVDQSFQPREGASSSAGAAASWAGQPAVTAAEDVVVEPHSQEVPRPQAKGGWQEGNLIVVTWPWGMLQYPEKESEFSWFALKKKVGPLGCKVHLRDRHRMGVGIFNLEL